MTRKQIIITDDGKTYDADDDAEIIKHAGYYEIIKDGISYYYDDIITITI